MKTLPTARQSINSDSVLPNGKAKAANAKHGKEISIKARLTKAAIERSSFIFNFLSLGFIIRGLYFIPPSPKVQGVKY